LSDSRADDERPGVPDSRQDDSGKVVLTTSYRYYALAILTFVYVFNFIDRQILVILQESIKSDLGLSDTQLGLLSGISFAVFYVTCGIPIARWADKSNRRNIVALAIGTWSFMTAISGAAQNFLQLLAARIGVGVGEAGGSPPAHSMISDMFPAAERATALSIYSMGINFGILIGFVLGGYVNDLLGWRWVFVVVGLPGILMALVVRFTLKEPPRGYSDNVTKKVEAPPFLDVFKLLWSRRSFRHMSVAAGLHAFVGYGVGQWIGSFFIRSYDLGSTTEIGFWLGIISGTAGAAGTFMGGYLADRFGQSDQRWYIWIPAVATLAAIPFSLAVYLIDNYSMALTIYLIPVFLGAMYLGPTLAMTHGIVSLRMRALASSILFFVLNLIGLGLGPLFTGWLSDQFTPRFGQDALKYALVCVVLVYIWCAFHYLMAARDIRADLKNAPN
jgi:MFS family permease